MSYEIAFWLSVLVNFVLVVMVVGAGAKLQFYEQYFVPEDLELDGLDEPDNVVGMDEERL